MGHERLGRPSRRRASARLLRMTAECGLDTWFDLDLGLNRTLQRCVHALGGVDSKDSLLGANQIQSCFWEAVLGVLDRLVLSDAGWERMAPLIIGRPDQKGSTGRDNRMFVEGVLWIVRTGSPWRDLPEAFGDWNSVFRRFSRWSLKGVWWRIFEAMSDDPDFEYLIIDSTIVRAHQHAAGAK